MWVHLEFKFRKRNNHLKRKDYFRLINLFNFILLTVKPKRKFWLFEDYPDVFLAMDISPFKLFCFSSLRLDFYKSILPDIVKDIKFVRHGKDEPNGEGFLNVMNAYSDIILNDDNKHSIKHLHHCILNQFGCDIKDEIEWNRSLLEERLKMLKKEKRKEKYGKKKSKESSNKRLH